MAPLGDAGAGLVSKNGDTDSPLRSAMPNPSRLSMLETMMLIRAHEEKLAATAGQTPGTCTAVGQEAAAVGVVGVLQLQDRILTNHRSAGHLIARGADSGRLMAEAM